MFPVDRTPKYFNTGEAGRLWGPDELRVFKVGGHVLVQKTMWLAITVPLGTPLRRCGVGGPEC